MKHHNSTNNIWVRVFIVPIHDQLFSCEIYPYSLTLCVLFMSNLSLLMKHFRVLKNQLLVYETFTVTKY